MALLGGCDLGAAGSQPSAGEALERAARTAGLVSDPRQVTPVGMFSSESDRVCIAPLDGTRRRIGVSIDYGDGQRCLARGTVSGRTALRMKLGDGCSFTARLDAERLRFPAVLPAACDRACTGRASLGALTAGRLSDAPGEALRARGADGALLCAG